MLPGDEVPPAPPLQVVRLQLIRCTWCRSSDVKCDGRPRGSSFRYYRCRGGCGQSFKVQIVLVDPLGNEPGERA